MDKSTWRSTLLCCLLAGQLLACTAPAADSGRAAVAAAVGRWVSAVNARDARALEATMTEDVELADGAATIQGRGAAVRSLRELAAQGALSATTREITVSNEVAWRFCDVTLTRKNGDVQVLGQALEIWKLVNGEWRLHRRLATAANAPDISPTRPPLDEPVLDQPRN